MLNQAQLDELSHADRLQRELALTFARSLHSHTCSRCRMLRVCIVVDCRARKFPYQERDWECFLCRTVIESASDEVGGGGDQ